MLQNRITLLILSLGFVLCTFAQNATELPIHNATTLEPLHVATAENTTAVAHRNATEHGNGTATTEIPGGLHNVSVVPANIPENATQIIPAPIHSNASEPTNATSATEAPLVLNGTAPEGHNATSPAPGPHEVNATTPETGHNLTTATQPASNESANVPSGNALGTGNETPSEAVSAGHQEVAQELPSSENVKFFIVGFRHGNRNPAQFLKNDTSHEKWAWEGPSQLTSIGRRQAASLGAFLRKRYGHIVPQEFYPSKVKAYSSSAERCQQTLQSVMLGFYPPVWNRSLLWQPVPYEISDPLLRMYNVKCPEYTSAYQPISDDSGKGADAWLKREDPVLLHYIAEHSGLNASLSDLGDIADNIGNMRLFGVPLPEWITNPTIPGYSAKAVFDAVMSFGEAHQILCANDSACARMMAGLWLNQIIDTLQQTKNNALKGRVANFYAAHTETVLSLIRLVKAKHVAETPTSAGFILEYTDVPSPSVRFIFHESDPNNPDFRIAELKELPYCAGEQWCKLDKFIESVKPAAFDDWQSACKLPKCPA